MTSDDPKPPVADDDFPEFSAPPRHRPPATHKAMGKAAEEPTSDEQSAVDDVIARLRRERDEGKR